MSTRALPEVPPSRLEGVVLAEAVEATEAPPPAEPAGPDPTALVYRYAAAADGIDSIETVADDLDLPVHTVAFAVSVLIELGLLRTEPTSGARLLVVGPEVALSQVVAPLERSAYRGRDLADQIRDRIRAVARPRFGPIDGFEGAAEIRGLLKAAAELCREEMLVLLPGGTGSDDVQELLDVCSQVFDSGVRVRVICAHRDRARYDSRARTRLLTDRGAEVRTVSRMPQAGVVFDGEVAVMFGADDEPARPVARRVHDREVVRFLIDLFDQLWECATVYASEEPGYAQAMDDLHQSIARLMAQGLTDDVVARRLGISVRTCRRHIAALLHNLNAVSRFQAGVQAAQRLPLAAAGG